MSDASIAVVIPTIPGREPLLERALVSVNRQFRQPDQVIIEYDQERSGAAAARNRALERVETDLVAWLDDDDELMRNHLGALEHALADYDLAYSTPRMVGGPDPTAVTQRGVWRKPWGVHFGREQERHLREQGSFIPITHLVRTELVRKAGGFPDGRTLAGGRYQGEDERYLIALLDAGARFTHINVPTWLWHVHAGHTAGKAG